MKMFFGANAFVQMFWCKCFCANVFVQMFFVQMFFVQMLWCKCFCANVFLQMFFCANIFVQLSVITWLTEYMMHELPVLICFI